MIITIFASIWAQNLWDELILKNEIKLLESKYWKNTKFFVFSYDYKNPFFINDNIIYVEYFPIWIRKIKNILKNIFNFFNFLKIVIKSDLIIIWWWWIIYDEEKQSSKNPLNQWIFRIKVFEIFNKKFNFFWVWINIKSDKNFNKVKLIFKKANDIKVRDNYSFELLKKLKIKSEIIKDPVFYDNDLNKKFENKSFLLKKVNSFDFTIDDLKDIDFKWKRVWLAFRKGYLINKSYKSYKNEEENKIIEIINFIIKNNWKVVLLAHSFHKTDVIANDYLYLKKFVKNDVIITQTMNETYETYKFKKIDICLSMRLHSMILSQVYWIKFVWISYTTKTDQILNNL